MEILKCENLCIGYDNNIILSNLNFKINEGDFICVTGEKGAGKSALLGTLFGISKPAGGKICFAKGVSAKDVGFLPQQTKLQGDLRGGVYEIVLSGFLAKKGLFPFYTKDEKQAAIENMSAMHVEDLKDRNYKDLSGGQKQRVLIARALCASGRLLALDEPFTGLDAKSAEDLFEKIMELNHSGVPVLIAANDISNVIDKATHVLYIAGANNFFGSVADYIKAKETNKLI